MDKEKITSFMLTLGLMQDQVSDIHQRVQASQNYTEELLGALYPANVFLPGLPATLPGSTNIC